MANAEYRVGEEATVSGVVVHVGINGGNHEYTIAVNDPDSERPVSVPQAGAPQLQANGEEETRKLNAERYEEVARETAKADKEAEKEADKDSIASDSTNTDTARKETASKTQTPDPAKVPAGGARNTAAK